MSLLRRRLMANFGANTCARGVAALAQIVSVPVMIGHWGTELYGEWILLSAIPSYLAMSDVGLGNAAGNEMTMLVAAGKQHEARCVFQSAHLLIAIFSSVALLLLALLELVPFAHLLHIRTLGTVQLRWIMFFLGVSAILSLQQGFIQQCLRAARKNALGVAVKSAIVLINSLVIFGTVWMGAGPVTAASLVMIVNGICTLAFLRILRQQAKWIELGVRDVQRSVIQRLWKPALSFMSFPVSNALTLDGTLIVIGSILGPVAAVTFSTARTVSRSVLQCQQLINASVWPEISAAFGAKDLALMRRIHRTSCQLSVVVCVLATSIVVAVGREVWQAWTVGVLRTDQTLLNLLLVQMLIGSVWYTSSVVPAATNQHQRMAIVILISSCGSLVITALLSRSCGLYGAAVSVTVADAAAAWIVFATSLRLTEDDFGSFLGSCWSIRSHAMSAALARVGAGWRFLRFRY